MTFNRQYKFLRDEAEGPDPKSMIWPMIVIFRKVGVMPLGIKLKL